MVPTTKELGDIGEEHAALYLAQAGCVILERNYRFRKLEVDIIVEDGKTLVFVEVKLRGPEHLVPPKEAINGSKQRKIFEAAEAFVEERKDDRNIRFDIVEVLLFGSKPKLNWIKDAFRPGW